MSSTFQRRELVRIGKSAEDRALQGGSDDEPLGDFAVSVVLSKNGDASGATQVKKFFAVFFSAIMGSALVL